jgi:predicted DsbA family dithiol-disulfide isomerase
VDDKNTMLVTLDVTLDIICPWCYIAIKEIDDAIERAKKAGLPLQFKVQFKPFTLDPTLPLDHAIDKEQLYLNKFGKERLESVGQVLKERAEKLGIAINIGGVIRQTTHCHRLLILACQKSCEIQKELIYEMCHAYFERNEDVGDPVNLAKYCDKVGFMSEAEAMAFLESDELMDEVKKSCCQASNEGISGVPFTVICNKWAISGGQPSDIYYNIFQKLAMNVVMTNA